MAHKTDTEPRIDEFGNNDDFWIFGYGSLIWKPPPHYDQRVPGYIQGYVRRFWQASEDHRGTPEAPGRVVTLIDKKHWETLTDHHEPTENVWGAAYHIPAAHVEQVRNYLDIREINGYSIQFTPFHPAPFTTRITSDSSLASAAVVEEEEEEEQVDDEHEVTPGSSSQNPQPNRRRRNDRLFSSIRASTSIHTHPSSPSTPITCLVYIGLPSNPQFVGPQDPDELARHILRSRGPSGENREYLYMLEKSLLELSAASGDAHVSDLVKRARAIEAQDRIGQGFDKEREWEERELIGGSELQRVTSTEEQEEVEK